jgi:hypothetical protein
LNDVLGRFAAQIAAAKGLGHFQAFIQLFADLAGQAGDFAIAGIHGFEGCCFQFFDIAALSIQLRGIIA